MKQELIKKILPIIETFVDKILESFKDLDKIRKTAIQKERQYQDLCESKEKELSDIKKLKVDSKIEIDKKITSLENAKIDHTSKASGYVGLTNNLNAKSKETEDNLAKSRIELIRSKDARTQSEKLKEDIDKIRGIYELKLESLKVDSEKLDIRELEADAKDIKLKSRDHANFITENKQNEKSHDLNEQELTVKAERKEVDRLIKRYNLKKQLET